MHPEYCSFACHFHRRHISQANAEFTIYATTSGSLLISNKHLWAALKNSICSIIRKADRLFSSTKKKKCPHGLMENRNASITNSPSHVSMDAMACCLTYMTKNDPMEGPLENQRNRSIIPQYRTVVIPGTHTAENHDFISSDQGSRSSISKPLRCSVRSGSTLSR